MAERLSHPGFFRRLFLGEEVAQETKQEIDEYKALRIALKLGRRLRIYYPASGTDVAPSYGFPGSNIFYNDTDPSICDTLRNGKMSHWKRRRMTIIQGDAFDPHNQPKNIDVAIIRNPSLGVESDKLASSLTAPVKEGGYVIAQSWGDSSLPAELVTRDDMRLIGYMERYHGRQELMQSDLNTIRGNLIKHKDDLFGAYPGKTFVFQKIRSKH